MQKRRGRSHREIKSEINIVPLLDVLLVLLLIFMATAPIINQSVEVNLPEAEESKTLAQGQAPPIIIEVSGVGQYNIVADHNRISLLPPPQIIQQVKQQLESNPKAVFLIGGAKEVPYDEIIKAINFLHQAGVKSVGLMTRPL